MGAWLIPRTPWGAVWRGLLVAAIALPLWALWIEPSGLRVSQYEVQVTGAKAANIAGLRIAVIADLHAGSPFIDEDKIRRVVALTNAAKPDLVLLTGDYVIQGVKGGHHMPIETIAALLKDLRAKLGVFAAIGNHDRWESTAGVTRALEANGIRVLENQSAMLTRGGRLLYLAGIGDYYTHGSKPAAALARIPAGRHALCFTHSPDVFPELPPACALTVAGHTHGGQVWLPLIGRPVVPSKYKQRYAIGIIREDGKVLFVSSGIGTSIYPVRLGVPPEISVLDIEE